MYIYYNRHQYIDQLIARQSLPSTYFHVITPPIHSLIFIPFLMETISSLIASKFRFSIDRGGTFTDVYAECPGGKIRVMKLLSEDPVNYPDAPREAIRRIIGEVSIANAAIIMQ